MNRWARIQTAIAGAGTLAFAAVGVHGYATRFDPVGLPLHAQLALVATLALVLPHSWIALFAIAARRRLIAVDAPALRAAESRMIVAALLALAAATTHFAIAGRVVTGQVAGWVHLVSASATAAVLVVALAVEARALARHQREAGALGGGQPGPSRVLDSASS